MLLRPYTGSFEYIQFPWGASAEESIRPHLYGLGYWRQPYQTQLYHSYQGYPGYVAKGDLCFTFSTGEGAEKISLCESEDLNSIH